MNKPVDIYLEDKKFFSGLFGEDTEMLDTGILDIKEDYVRLVSGKEIETRNITKIETGWRM